MVAPLMVKTANPKVSLWEYLVNTFSQGNVPTKWVTQVMVSCTVTFVHTAIVQVSASHTLLKSVEIDANRSQKRVRHCGNAETQSLRTKVLFFLLVGLKLVSPLKKVNTVAE